MTIFSILVLLSKDQAESDLVGAVKALLQPYDEMNPLEEYEKDCWCIGKFAHQAAIEAAGERYGPSGFLLYKFNEEFPEGSEAQWCEFVAQYLECKRQVFEAHPDKDKPDPSCGFYTAEFCPDGHKPGERFADGKGCGGTGRRRAMRNPAAKFYVTSIPGLQSALSGADQPHNDPGEFKCALCEGTGTMPGSDELEAEVTEQTNGCNGCQGTGRYAQPCHSILSISNNKWIPAAIVTPDGEWHDRVDDWDQRVRALLEQHRDAIAVVVVCTARDTINQSEDREFEYLKAFFKRVVRNPDNRYLEPVAAGPFTVGFVDEVNGPGATEVPEFNPTRHELIELVKYWKKTALDSEYWVFLAAQIGSRDMRVQPYAYRRVSRIADLLGEEEIQKVVDEVENEFGKSQDPRTWEIFLHGTEEEREQLQLEIQRGLDEPDDNESLPQKRSPEAPDGE